MENPEHIKRMIAEMAALDDRVNKLDDALHGGTGLGIQNRLQVNLMWLQLDAMKSYRRVLAMRIEHDTELAKEQLDAQSLES